MKLKDLKPCQMYRFPSDDEGTTRRWVGSPVTCDAERSVIPLTLVPLTYALMWYKRPL